MLKDVINLTATPKYAVLRDQPMIVRTLTFSGAAQLNYYPSNLLVKLLSQGFSFAQHKAMQVHTI